MLVTSIFILFHKVFCHSKNEFQCLSHIYFVVCKCFQFGQAQYFAVWWRVIIILQRNFSWSDWLTCREHIYHVPCQKTRKASFRFECPVNITARATRHPKWRRRSITRLHHSDHLGQFYESSLGCMPTEYFRKRQQQPPWQRKQQHDNAKQFPTSIWLSNMK